MAGTISLNGYLYGGSGGLTDVRVNGESVVARGVADIDLSPYAKKTATQQALNAKQDKIVAGSNISIGADGKTISADLSSRIPTTAKGAVNGVAELDSSGNVPTSQLPYSAGTNMELSGETFNCTLPLSVANDKLCITYDDGN